MDSNRQPDRIIGTDAKDYGMHTLQPESLCCGPLASLAASNSDPESSPEASDAAISSSESDKSTWLRFGCGLALISTFPAVHLIAVCKVCCGTVGQPESQIGAWQASSRRACSYTASAGGEWLWNDLAAACISPEKGPPIHPRHHRSQCSGP